MDYLSSAEIAKKWNVSQRRVAVFCKEGRVKGAVLIGRMWMIPKDAEKPIDPRRIMNKEEDLSDIINDGGKEKGRYQKGTRTRGTSSCNMGDCR